MSPLLNTWFIYRIVGMRETSNINMISKKGGELNKYWRDSQNKHYRRNRPDLQVRAAAKDYLTKKEQLKGSTGETKLLDDLISQIRSILGEKP